MGFEAKGIKEAIQNLEQKKRNIEKLHGKHEISFNDLFTSEFMNKYTDFKSIDEMLHADGFKIDSNEDLEKSLGDEWDALIHRHTKFANWDEMKRVAGKEYFTEKIRIAMK